MSTKTPRKADTSDRNLIAFMPDGVVLLDEHGVIQAINPAATELLQLTLTGADRASFVATLRRTACSEWQPLIDRILTGEKSEVLIKLQDGRNLLTTVRSVPRDPTESKRLLIVLRDLSVIDHERRQATAPSSRTGFQFVSERKLRPDLGRQRQISADFDRLVTLGERAVVQGARLLILGESGVGKTEVARYLHDYIADRQAPFVHVNCGSIPESLFEAELFGYERGAFTGALQTGRKGYIEAADGGTLFLDEVGEVPLVMQSRLLKFLESGSIQRVGGAEERSIRVRVISATNRNLEEMVRQGQFRRDLYYRLSVVPLLLRPLRDSPELIEEITDYFLTIINQRRPAPLVLSSGIRQRLLQHPFPGNIRELFNVIQQLSVVAQDTAEVRHLPPAFTATVTSPASALEGSASSADLKEQVRSYERTIIERAIALYGSKRKAAEALGVDIGTIVRKTQLRH